MCSVSVVTVVIIHTMEDDQRLNTLVHEGDTLRSLLQHCKKREIHCFNVLAVQVVQTVCPSAMERSELLEVTKSGDSGSPVIGRLRVSTFLEQPASIRRCG